MWKFDRPRNEADQIPSYEPGSPEREALAAAVEELKRTPAALPLMIDGREVWTDDVVEIRSPHDRRLLLGQACLAGEGELETAVASALEAHRTWSRLPWPQRAAVFQRAADLLSGPRRTAHLAAIMLNQSKTPYEAEIDLAELVDFWRYNVWFLNAIYGEQPEQGHREINRFDWRPLEGFVLAISPFNFYSIGGNLPTAPVLCGNVALWKPARSVLVCNYAIQKLLVEAGLPAGVLNFVPFASRSGGAVLSHPDLAGLHFTGSYETFVELQRQIGMNMDRYRSFPRVVGETGGKDFLFVHASADAVAVGANIVRGAFEYQGQKCSAVSRVYMAESLWPQVRDYLLREVADLPVGPTENLTNFMGAVIDEEAFDRIGLWLDRIRDRPESYELLVGGGRDASEGWFIEPTVVVVRDPKDRIMREEIFGPLVAIYLYPDEAFEKTLHLCDASTEFALTGALFARDREAIAAAEEILRHSAGNFYINDKPTGAVVGRQPFGGSRHSGTNDKAGYRANLLRWLSPRLIKENTVPARQWQRPFMG